MSSIPLINQHLKRPLPWLPLGQFPTPVSELKELAEELRLGELWLKDDGPSGAIYGGNKVRKLEFLLARVRERKATRIVTTGAFGSHHCVATAAYGQQLGLEVILYLYPQPLNAHVLDNLRLDSHFGARMIRLSHISLLPFKAALGAIRRGQHRGKEEIIPPGGSDPLGAVGYVEGGLELARQIKHGQAPEPDTIFVAAGTSGTAAGLTWGLRLGGLETPVVAVQVVDSIVCNRFILNGLARLTARFLRSRGLQQIPDKAPPGLIFQGGFLGQGYGYPTSESEQALAVARAGGLPLDPTYTAKAFAGMLGFIREHQLQAKRHLFWNTISSIDHSETLKNTSLESIPEDFHQDFESVLGGR